MKAETKTVETERKPLTVQEAIGVLWSIEGDNGNPQMGIAPTVGLNGLDIGGKTGWNISTNARRLEQVREQYKKKISELNLKHCETNPKTGLLVVANGEHPFKSQKDKDAYEKELNEMNKAECGETVLRINAKTIQPLYDKGLLKGKVLTKAMPMIEGEFEDVKDDKKDDKK